MDRGAYLKFGKLGDQSTLQQSLWNHVGNYECEMLELPLCCSTPLKTIPNTIRDMPEKPKREKGSTFDFEWSTKAKNWPSCVNRSEYLMVLRQNLIWVFTIFASHINHIHLKPQHKKSNPETKTKKNPENNQVQNQSSYLGWKTSTNLSNKNTKQQEKNVASSPNRTKRSHFVQVSQVQTFLKSDKYIMYWTKTVWIEKR